MLLEYEITRITGWVEDRIMPPRPAASALRHLVCVYARAKSRPLDLTLFESFVYNQFERHWTGDTSRSLPDIIISRAVRLLYSEPAATGEVLRINRHLPDRGARPMTVLEI